MEFWASPLLLGLPSSARPPHRPAAPHLLAVFGRPSAPRPGGPTPRILKVLVLTPCRARGLRSPPRVPAPAKRLGGQAASAWVRASCASGGRWGFAGRCPAWQTASSSGAACSSLWSLLLQRRHGGRPGRCTFRPLRFFHAWAGGTFSWRGSVFFYGESRICSFDAPCCPSGTPSGLAAHSHNAVLRVCIP